MTRKIMVAMAAVLLAVCLLSGGCSQADNSKLKALQDFIKLPTSAQNNPVDTETITPNNNTADTGEKTLVKLYFMDSNQTNLVVEQRSIGKVAGIARETINELIKGPTFKENAKVFPDGTRLIDINIKPDGMCIVDLSSEANQISSKEKGKLMVQAVANTLGQYPTINQVTFLINGEKVGTLGGVVDVSKPVAVGISK